MSGLDDRKYWVNLVNKTFRPVLQAFSERRCKRDLPVENDASDKRYGAAGRRDFSYLEALARSLVGIAPWIECSGLAADSEEEKLRLEFASMARSAIDAATDPSSPDYVNWSFSFQPIVDAAFLVHAVLRAPNELWHKLEPRVQDNLVTALQATKTRKPHFNNWLLFSAMIETGLKFMGRDWDRMRVDYALRQHEQWYKGDGLYGDGPEFHNDHYNSFVIQPFLMQIISVVKDEYPEWRAMENNIFKRARRYAEVQERLIGTDGAFPPLGRSLAYRCGAFQHLADVALRHELTSALTPEQVRCGLTAVIKRSMEPAGTFDDAGWLRIGFCGAQPEIAEMYIRWAVAINASV